MSITKNPSRVVWITQFSDAEISKVTRQITVLDFEDSSEPIYLFLKSPGGFVDNAIELYNFLQQRVTSLLVVVGLQAVYSCANIIMSCGDIRIAVKGTKFLHHNSRENFSLDGEVSLSQSDCADMIEELKRCDKILFSLTTSRKKTHSNPCKLTSNSLLKRIRNTKDGEYYISETTAKKLGFVDFIATDISKIKTIVQKFCKKNKKKE